MNDVEPELKGEPTRARLLSLLSEACELEHALGCSYLFAAFSIKREIQEGIDWRQQQMYRLWASQIYHVAAQEMLHLAQAWNLLTAMGGSPYYNRPNFPQPGKVYPLNVAIVLRRCDVRTLQRFVYYESPAHQNLETPDEPLPADSAWPINETFAYRSVGQLYDECLAIIHQLDEKELFVGPRDFQIGEDYIDFPEIVAVRDRQSASEAIRLITEQGEGVCDDREDSHYGIFRSILRALQELPAEGEVARPVGDNPFVRVRRDQMVMYHPQMDRSGIKSTEITNTFAILAMDLFDDVYVAMLQAISYVFSNTMQAGESLSTFAESSLQLMTTVIKPLGEAICLLPSGHAGVNAGPSFSFSRHTHLPPVPGVAAKVYRERLQQLSEHCRSLAQEDADVPPIAQAQIASAATNLERITSGIL